MPDAHVAIREARDRIQSLAATFEDADLRVSLVTNVDANARTLSWRASGRGEEAGTA